MCVRRNIENRKEYTHTRTHSYRERERKVSTRHTEGQDLCQCCYYTIEASDLVYRKSLAKEKTSDNKDIPVTKQQSRTEHSSLPNVRRQQEKWNRSPSVQALFLEQGKMITTLKIPLFQTGIKFMTKIFAVLFFKFETCTFINLKSKPKLRSKGCSPRTNRIPLSRQPLRHFRFPSVS